jgi:hypothetical protein
MRRKTMKADRRVIEGQENFPFIPKAKDYKSISVSYEASAEEEPKGCCATCRKRATPCDECSSRSFKETPSQVKQAVFSLSFLVSSADGPAFGTFWDGKKRASWAGIRISDSASGLSALSSAGLTKTGWSSHDRPSVSEWIWTNGDTSRWVGDPYRLAAFPAPKENQSKEKAARKVAAK